MHDLNRKTLVFLWLMILIFIGTNKVNSFGISDITKLFSKKLDFKKLCGNGSLITSEMN